MFILFFSTDDICIIFKYVFAENTSSATPKRRRISESKITSIVDYSYVKLPAFVFVEYLEKHLVDFLRDCREHVEKID